MPYLLIGSVGFGHLGLRCTLWAIDLASLGMGIVSVLWGKGEVLVPAEDGIL